MQAEDWENGTGALMFNENSQEVTELWDWIHTYTHMCAYIGGRSFSAPFDPATGALIPSAFIYI